MKFIKLESRGGNYLVVAENVAWLRTADNGQTSVGIIGGQPLLVVGTIEEVAAKILAGTAEEPSPAVEPPAPPPEGAPDKQKAVADIASPAASAELTVEAVATPPRSEPEPEPAPVPETQTEMEAAEPDEAPAPSPRPVASKPVAAAAVRAHAVPARSSSLWERPPAPPAQGLKIKAGSQRMMGLLE